MARTVARLPEGSRITDHISLGVIAKTFPVSKIHPVLAALTGEEHDWKPVNYYEEVQPFAIGRSSLKRFPVLAFESGDADFIAENLNSVIQSCQNDR